MHRTNRTPASATLLALVLAVTAIGASGAASHALAGNPTVTVGPGDTLSGIALRHHTTVARLVALNHIADPNRIYAGQRLVVSGPQTPVASTAASSPLAPTSCSSGST